MFKHLLVPLDGSHLAESALLPAGELAARLGASVTFVHVIERGAPAQVHGDRHLVTAVQAEGYLNEIAQRAPFKGLRVVTHVHTAEVSDVAQSITEHSAELVPDLIVMTTHGRGGARRLLFGTIAQQVIAMGKTPVLIVRPIGEKEAPDARTGDWRIILAPINGDPSHEKGLGIAAELAGALHSRIHLLMVVPRLGDLHGAEAATGALMPSATRIKLEMDSVSAREYVESRARDLETAAVTASSETVRGDPADAIVEAVGRVSADLVVMGTHGRAGVDAFWSGSVAPQVVARTNVPLLLLPLKE